MIVRHIVRIAAGAAAVATAVAASVVAAGFALYALLEPYIGRPGAAAIVALILALVAAIAGLILTRTPRPSKHAAQAEPSLAERVIEIARAKPVFAAAGAIAAGLIAWRNPALVGVVLAALLKKPDPDKL